MRRFWIRVSCLALLGLVAAAAGAGVAKASAALAHACCEDASRADAQQTDCHGFLPLSCCDAAALPGHDPGPPAPACLLLAAPLAPIPRIASLRASGLDALAPRPPPARSSVVLQI